MTLASYTYDAGGRKATETDALGRVQRFDYDAVNRPIRLTQVGYHDRTGSTRDLVLETRAYDAAGNLTRRVDSGLRTTDLAYDAAGRLVSSAAYATADGPGAARTTTFGYDASGNLLSRTLSDAAGWEQVLLHYGLDQGQLLDRLEVVNQGSPAAPNANRVTTYSYDQRGLRTSMVEPRGNYGGANPADFTTNYVYDEAGRLSGVTAPPVSVESGGGTPATLRRAQLAGYDTFGDLTHLRDARANVTSYTYDLLGRRTAAAYPTYVTPAVAGSSSDSERSQAL